MRRAGLRVPVTETYGNGTIRASRRPRCQRESRVRSGARTGRCCYDCRGAGVVVTTAACALISENDRGIAIRR